MALNKKDLETIETMLTNVVKAEITPLQKELNDLKKSVNALSKDNAKVESSKATKTSTSKTSKTSKSTPKKSTKTSDRVLQFITNKTEKSISWKSWIDHDTEFKPMDTIAQKYKATRKGKKYTFKSAQSANAFYTELTALFPKAQFERA